MSSDAQPEFIATFNFLISKKHVDVIKHMLAERHWTFVKQLDDNAYGFLWLVSVPKDVTGKMMTDDLEYFMKWGLRKWTSDDAIMNQTEISKCIPDDAMKPTIHTVKTNPDTTTVPEKKPITKSPKLRIIPKVDQTWSIKRIAKEACPSGWEKFFEIVNPELCEISEMLDEIEKRDGGYLPLKKDIFNFLWLTKPSEIRLIMIGQDPYYQILPSGLPRATGLAFSIRKTDSIPSSLSNIYKELKSSIEGFKEPTHGDLTKWARQGVFLPNMCLTVRQNEAGSHKSLWMDFIVKLLLYINERNPDVIYLLLGKDAQKVKRQIDSKITVLESSHPSGLSCNRGFLGCGHFKRINDLLIGRGLEPIRLEP